MGVSDTTEKDWEEHYKEEMIKVGNDFLDFGAVIKIEKQKSYNQALEDAEKRYREWSKSEYGRLVADDVLPLRVIRSLRK